MLRFLRIRDFALIRELEVEFGPGLNLLTGETGSGKSILVDALALVLGERASLEMVRSGCEQAVVEGIFALDPEGRRVLGRRLGRELEGAGVELSADPGADDELLIRREVSTAGRNRAYVNGNLAPLALVKALGDALADIHGQHDHQALARPESHIEFLDRFGANRQAVEEVQASYARLVELAAALDALRIDDAARLRQIDALRYQIDEIHRAAIRPGEPEELAAERGLLANRERVFSLSSETYALVYDSEPAILGQANRVKRALEALAALDPRWAPHLEAVSEALYRLEDLAFFARDYASGIDFSPSRLDAVETRLAELERLSRKYGQGPDGILKYGEACSAELQALLSHTDREHELEAELEREIRSYGELARRLSEKRRRDARRLEREMRRELGAISMAKTEFVVRFEAADGAARRHGIPAGCSGNGVDRVEFLVSPNPGEELRPLARIASGGELSRIGLALKSLCGGDDSARTLVFDEVDAGIGGRAAEAVGRRLTEIARCNQVLCVTHLPQIAAFATRHYRVWKESAGGRTETFVELLRESLRAEELARMLGGATITETTRAAAREMLGASRGKER